MPFAALVLVVKVRMNFRSSSFVWSGGYRATKVVRLGGAYTSATTARRRRRSDMYLLWVGQENLGGKYRVEMVLHARDV